MPIRNERAVLPALLAALRDQRGLADVRVTLCCFFDGCDDGSEAVVRAEAGGLALHNRAGPRHADANAGRARGAAMALGLEALGDGGGVLLSTDADSRPAPDWIARALTSLETCDVVAGLIRPDGGSADPAHDRLEAFYDRLYAHRRALDPVPWEPAPGHHYTGGANLAFRAQSYRALGGFRPLPSAEDAVLVDDAGRAGLRVRRDRSVGVFTSTRRDGRAPDGLAAWLRLHDALGGAALQVGDPRAADWQYLRHAAARAAFARLPERGAAAELGRLLALGADHVIGVARDCPNGEAFAMRIVPAAPEAGRLMPLAEAERILADLEGRDLGYAA